MRLFMIFIALVIAVAAGIGFWVVTGNQKEAAVVVSQPAPTQVAVEESTVLVAREDLPVGHRIAEQDLDRQPWPKHLVLPEFIPAEESATLIDKVTRTPFKKNEPLARSRLANPNDPGYLAAQLPAGMRAVTVAVDAITGISGFIFPGDRVDVLITHDVGLEQDLGNDSSEVPAAGDAILQTRPKTIIPLPIVKHYQQPVLMTKEKSSSQPVIGLTEVLVSNVRVLAVGERAAAYNNEEEKGTPTSITIEVSELDAAKLRHSPAGAISLTLRSLKDADDKSIPRPVADADMSHITPPAYFPTLYADKPYKTEFIEPEAVPYGSVEDEDNAKKKNGNVAIIRGVKKEIVGVTRQ